MSTTRKSWRDVLPVHPAADDFPLLSPEELTALGKDIAARGILEPIVMWSDEHNAGEFLLDGRNRLDAAEKAGLLTVKEDGRLFIQTRDGQCDVRLRHMEGQRGSVYDYDPVSLVVLSFNIHPRHLSAEQRRDLISTLLKANPAQSNLQVAKLADAAVDR